MRTGFALAEVVVALVILTMGLLALAGSAVVAARTLAAAAELEDAVAVAEGVADSLLSMGYAGPDSARLDVGWVRWSAGPTGDVTVEVANGGRRVVGLKLWGLARGM